jgi:type II secretory pathway component PulM
MALSPEAAMMLASMLQTLRERFDGLSARDQRALQVGALVLVPLTLLMLDWTIREHLAGRRVAVAASADLADRANRVIGARIAAGEDLTVDAATPLPQRVSRSLERAGLQGSLVAPQSSAPATEQVELTLRDTSFDGLVSMLGALARNDGVTVTSTNIVRTGPGRVDAALVLRAP